MTNNPIGAEETPNGGDTENGQHAPSRERREFRVLSRITIPVTIKYLRGQAINVVHQIGQNYQRLSDRGPYGDGHEAADDAADAFNEMFFNYMFSVFDAFLSDLTKFLMLTRLTTLPSDVAIPLSELTSAASAAKAVSERVSKKSRNVAARTLIDRLTHVNAAFGLGVDLTDDVRRKIVSYSEMRNQLTHDQDVFSMELGPDFVVVSKARSKIDIKQDYIDEATATFAALIIGLFKGAASHYSQTVPESVDCHELVAIERMLTILRKRQGAVV